NVGGMSDLSLTTSESPPRATSLVEATLNLPSSAAAPATTPLSPDDASSYNNTTSLTVYDSLGAAHTATMYFIKGANPNEWTTQLYVDGTAVGGPQSLTYSTTGELVSPADGLINFPAYAPTTGAEPLSLSIDFSATTQYGENFSVNAITQDGY